MSIGVSGSCEIKIKFFNPTAKLIGYILTIFHIEVLATDGHVIEDLFFPEWPTLRFHTGSLPSASNRSGHFISQTNFPVTGPQAQETRFSIGSSRQWAVTLQPNGWSKLIGRKASDFANGLFDGHTDPAFERFRPLANSLFNEGLDMKGELEKLQSFLIDMLDPPHPREELIRAIYTASLDPQLVSVKDMVQCVGMPQRKLERLCKSAFGFAPKLLLRRQRFLRSLSAFTMDPTMKWIGAIDSSYHDQAHFVRDFRQFMGMTPSEYAALHKPMLEKVIGARQAYTESVARRLEEQRDPFGFGLWGDPQDGGADS